MVAIPVVGAGKSDRSGDAVEDVGERVEGFHDPLEKCGDAMGCLVGRHVHAS